MSFMEQVALYSILFIFSSVFSSLYLGADRRSIAISATLALLPAFFPHPVISTLCSLILSSASYCIFMKATVRETTFHGALFISVSLVFSLFSTLLSSLIELSPVYFIYSIFFLCHFPALVFSFPSLHFTVGGKTGRIPAFLIWGVVAVLLIISFIPASSGGNAVALLSLLSALAFFWTSLWALGTRVQYEKEREQNDRGTEYHRDMAAFMNVVRSQRHDYNMHVQTVSALVERGEIDRVREYVDALRKDTEVMNEVLRVKDPAVAALIHHYREKAREEGIRLDVDLRDNLGGVCTSAYETNKIIGNLLQNAMDELSCHGSDEEKSIVLETFKRGGFALVRVSNCVRDTSILEKGEKDFFREGYSTKKGHDGVGLSSIRTLLRGKGGDVMLWSEGDTVHFVASIPVSDIE